jgi:hypothetical protein
VHSIVAVIGGFGALAAFVEKETSKASTSSSNTKKSESKTDDSKTTTTAMHVDKSESTPGSAVQSKKSCMSLRVVI